MFFTDDHDETVDEAEVAIRRCESSSGDDRDRPQHHESEGWVTLELKVAERTGRVLRSECHLVATSSGVEGRSILPDLCPDPRQLAIPGG